MPFPEVTRIIYKRNPINKVICQFRFPPILKIDSEIPSSFQEIIRTNFPLYSESVDQKQDFPTIFQPNMPNPIQLLSRSINRNHVFETEDKLFCINLTRTYIALSTKKYERWEQFSDIFNKIMRPFIEIYNPSFITRVGLRYVDIFNRTQLNISDSKWDTLINPLFLGILSSSFSERIEGFESLYEIILADDISKARISTSFVHHNPSHEKCYMVDSDFSYSKGSDYEFAFAKLDFLHDRATRLIRWIITDKLHNAMEPMEI